MSSPRLINNPPAPAWPDELKDEAAPRRPGLTGRGRGMARTDRQAAPKTKLDLERIEDAEARRVRRDWLRAENHRRTWANYHPILNR